MPPTPFDILRGLVGKPDPVIFDVGANRGQSTEIYRMLFERCTVHAFEPQRAVFEQLQQRLGGLDRVTVNHAALGQTVGTAVLHRATDTGSASLLSLNEKSWWGQALQLQLSGTEAVTVDTIDHYCAERNIAEIDFLKLDVQGFEPECLRGAYAMLTERRIGVIQAEIIYHGLYERTTRFSDLERLLDPPGYRLFTIFDIKVGDETGELLYLDAVFNRA
jgi:FkbM family methyltransferase